MKTRLQEKLASLIIEEMSERLKQRSKILDILADFSDFAPEKVTEEFLNEFEKFLNSGLREEILKRLSSQQKPSAKIQGEEIKAPEIVKGLIDTKTETDEIQTGVAPDHLMSEVLNDVISDVKDIFKSTEINLKETQIESQSVTDSSILSGAVLPAFEDPRKEAERPSIYFSKEKRTNIVISSDDWIYLYGFSYAPNSEGKGFPSIELEIDGVSQGNKIFGLDYGDVRIFMSKINLDEYATIRTGDPVLKPQETLNLRFKHSNILNQIKSQEIIVPMDFWTINRGSDIIVKVIEEKYLSFLHALIDVHDVIDWDVEVSVLDDHMVKILSSDIPSRSIDLRREGRHQKVQKIDVKHFEKVLFKEKEIAHKINTSITHVANKTKIDHLISLESSFLEGWKPILSARYVIGKEKRKAFHHTVLEIQQQFEKFKVMIVASSPKVRFKFQ
jgi:hypothetical protein